MLLSHLYRLWGRLELRTVELFVLDQLTRHDLDVVLVLFLGH